jgi:Citrate synthase, C-terminal domain
MRLMACAIAGEAAPSLAETLRRGWCPRDPGANALLGAAMILCADHELPVSTFAARCVASSEATPYAVVGAGLAALGGVRHGGALELVEAFMREVETVGGARAAISGRLRRGEKIPGWRPARRRAAARRDRRLPRLPGCRALRRRRRRSARSHGRPTNRGLRAGDARAGARVAGRRGRRPLRARQNCGLDRTRHRAVRRWRAHPPQGPLRGGEAFVDSGAVYSGAWRINQKRHLSPP